MNNKKESNNTFSMPVLFMGILAIGVVISLILSIVMFKQNQEIHALLHESVLNGKGDTQEDDIKIANEYYIRSTLPISDAYKSGDSSKLDDKQKETLDMASAILKEIIKDSMSDFEKEKAVYDWMIKNLQNDSGVLTVIPTTQADCENPYGVLKYHNAICVGYATTFRLFMQMMDIPCMIVHNNELFHSWNLVQIDGHWYHTDVYSDMGDVPYNNFNMDDPLCMRNQEWDRDFFPEADSLEYNVICRNAKEPCDMLELPKLIRDMLDTKETSVSFKYGMDLTDQQAGKISAILSNTDECIRNTEKYASYGLVYNFIPVEDGYVLAISLTKYSDELDVELSEKEVDQIDKATSAAFGDLKLRDNVWEEDADFDE